MAVVAERDRAYAARVRVALGLLVVVAAGCLPAEEPHVPLSRTGNQWADCYRRFQPGISPAADIEALGSACAAPAGMQPVTPIHTGEARRAGDAPERFVFRARRGRCYRAFAVADPGVEDLDVTLRDEQGDVVAGDVSRDRWPVVPPRGPACADRDGTFSIAVSVARGRGAWHLQIWGGGAHDQAMGE
jgi:hypothetical protein